MPELPEVETVRRGLEDRIISKIIDHVEYDWPKSFPNSDNDVASFLLHSQIISVQRRGKVLIIGLDTNFSLLVHLKMTGQLVYVDAGSPQSRFGAGHPNDSLVHSLPDSSTRVTITFSDSSTLYFNDQRKFGWIKLCHTNLVFDEPLLKKMGPEPLDLQFTPDKFIARVRKRKNAKIKAVLLDQEVIAGIGNIYADESLWGAKIHPDTIISMISDRKLQQLYSEIVYVLNLSLEKGGSTDKNYVQVDGKKGSYIQFARVFRKENTPCPRCGINISKIRVVGRGTHICKNCQKIKKSV